MQPAARPTQPAASVPVAPGVQDKAVQKNKKTTSRTADENAVTRSLQAEVASRISTFDLPWITYKEKNLKVVSNIVKGIRAATSNCKTSFVDASHYWTKHNRYNKDLENARSAANGADTAEVPEATSNATEAAEIGTA
ncbi:hypothetical protein WJX74_003364 [Apatococcus lobatus]|uniref:Uncharacterized protein n=1 Tax=Apatococcus lobatus TaxID=904363 RepID=A0AAW1Q6P4_9CHLO